MTAKPIKKAYKRTDLASELVRPRVKKIDELISVTTVSVSAADAEKIGKPEGVYTSAVSPIVAEGDTISYPRLVRALARVLEKYIGGAKKLLVAGLGNPEMKADSLGAETLRFAATGEKIKTFLPNVPAATGTESFDLIRAVVREIGPDVVIAADALCAASVKRLGTVFQVSDAGITPGSGVGNSRREISAKTLGVPVIGVGVPCVVYSRTIALETGGDGKTAGEIILTLGEIDRVASDAGAVIGEAINVAAGVVPKNSCFNSDKVV